MEEVRCSRNSIALESSNLQVPMYVDVDGYTHWYVYVHVYAVRTLQRTMCAVHVREHVHMFLRFHLPF